MTDLRNITTALQELSQAKCTRWDKSVIVEDLTDKTTLSLPAIRAIASMVEEKIFNLAAPVVTTALIRQLVLTDTAAIMQAEQQLLNTSEDFKNKYKKNASNPSKHLTKKV